MGRGTIVPIGGAEEKIRNRLILRRFVELCGGADARIAVIPTASQLDRTGPRYQAIFGELGAERTWTLPLNVRVDGARPEYLEALEQATGVFMTGGNQLRLSTTIGGTEFADALRRRNREGLHVAGTSAGAAFLSEHMIAFGKEGATPRGDMVTLAPGLGLTPSVVIDQHFRQRDRLGRLLTALTYNPRPIGIGLDEDAAAFIDGDDVLEVAGTGTITVVDPSEVEYSSMDSAHPHDPVCIIGLRLHVLTAGATYNIRTRRAAAPPVAARSTA